MMPQPPPGQGPIDPRGAFSPPPAPGAGGAMPPPGYFPPMPPMPPMMMPPFYPPPPRGRSFAGAIFTTLATTVLSLSLLLNIFLLFSSASGGREGFKTETLIEGDATEQVAVIPVHGVIDDRMVERFDKMLAKAEKDANVKAIVLDIDSPGGGVTPSDEMYARVLQLKEQSKKPVVATIGSLGASGGYYVSCGADYVFAEETSLTGSIGVILPLLNYHELADKWGIKENDIISDGATFKTAGSAMQPINPAETQYFKGIVNQAFTRFKSVVTKARGKSLKSPIDDVANGKIYTAAEAKAMGLVDDIGYKEAAYTKAASLAGLKKKHVVKYEPDLGVLGALFESKFGAGTPKSNITVNGVNVNIDRNLLTDLLTPRPMYLWRGQ